MQDESIPLWLAVVIACAAAILAGAAGVGGTLMFAEQGPPGELGEQGETGPRGPRGPAVDVAAETQDLEARVAALEDEIFYGTTGTDLTDLDSRVSELEGTVSDICFELDLFC